MRKITKNQKIKEDIRYLKICVFQLLHFVKIDRLRKNQLMDILSKVDPIEKE